MYGETGCEISMHKTRVTYTCRGKISSTIKLMHHFEVILLNILYNCVDI